MKEPRRLSWKLNSSLLVISLRAALGILLKLWELYRCNTLGPSPRHHNKEMMQRLTELLLISS